MATLQSIIRPDLMLSSGDHLSLELLFKHTREVNKQCECPSSQPARDSLFNTVTLYHKMQKPNSD